MKRTHIIVIIIIIVVVNLMTVTEQNSVKRVTVSARAGKWLRKNVGFFKKKP